MPEIISPFVLVSYLREKDTDISIKSCVCSMKYEVRF
jgi:hypothetical protein